MAMKGFAVRPVFGFHDETGPSRVFFSSMKKAVAGAASYLPEGKESARAGFQQSMGHRESRHNLVSLLVGCCPK